MHFGYSNLQHLNIAEAIQSHAEDIGDVNTGEDYLRGETHTPISKTIFNSI